MRLNAIGLVVPDWAHRQFGLVYPERRFGLGELDVRLPQRLVGPLGDIGAQDVDAFGEVDPLGPVGAVGAAQQNAGRLFVVVENCDREGARGTAVTLEQSPDLTLDRAPVQRPGTLGCAARGFRAWTYPDFVEG